MSAQVLLSVVAPAPSAAPPATADADASGFKGLLGDAMNGAEGPKDTRPDQTVKTRTDSDVGAAAGFLIAPAGLPAATPPPATGSASADSTDALTAADGAAAGSGPTPAFAPVPEAAPVAPPKDAAATDKPAAGGNGVPLKGADVPALPEGAKAAPADAASAKAAAAAALAAAAARAQSSAAPAPVASPAALTPPVAPPPLRALAERTSSPLEPGTKSAAAADLSKAAAPAGVSPLVSDQPVKAVDAAVPAQRDLLPPDAGSDDPVSPAPGPAEGAAAQTQAHAVVHETAPSQISRASLEATAQIAAQIVRKLEGRSTRFEMALTPDELGRVDVKLDIDSDGRLAARLAFDNPLAATDLKGRADELRRQLQDAGFRLADNALEFADRDSSSSAFDRGGDARKGQERAFAAASRLNADIDVAQPPRWMALSLSPSGLDLKV